MSFSDAEVDDVVNAALNPEYRAPWPTRYQPSVDTAPTDLEERAGIPSLEALHAERREIVDKLSPLSLLYGSGGDRADAKRRQHRDVIAKLLRAELPGGSDLPENRIQSMANSDPRHTAFCDTLDKQYIEYQRWETALKEVNERIDARRSDQSFVKSEMGLDR